MSSTEPRESALTLLLYGSSALTGRGAEGLDSSSSIFLLEREGSRPERRVKAKITHQVSGVYGTDFYLTHPTL